MEIFDLFTEEVNQKFDKMGYDLLRSNGYDVAGANKSYKRMAKLKRAMKSRGEELTYKDLMDKETGTVLIWYELVKVTGELVAKSEAMKVVYTAMPMEGKDEV